MRLLWAVLAAVSAVVFCIIVVITAVRVAQHRPTMAIARLPEIAVAVVALAAAVFLGVLALPPPTPLSSPDSAMTPGASAPVPGPSRSTPAQASSSTRVTRNVVKIVKLADRPGVVDVTVRVFGPPSTGTEYLLVAHFRSRFQYKGEVSSEIGDHVVEADVRLADPGSWRDFFVVGANPDAVRAWEASTAESLLEMPAGSKVLTQWTAHQMPSS